MISWQKRARLGVATFGVAVAVIVYFAIGERRTAPPPAPVERLDPKAMVETTAGIVQQIQGAQRDFEVAFDSSLHYADNSTKMVGVRIAPRNRAGRDFVVTAREAQAGQGQRILQLRREIRLAASDGFELATDAATFSQDDGLARAAGHVVFGRGRMTGSGVNVSYHTDSDVLVVGEHAHVTTAGDDGGTLFDFTASTATLDRAQHVLTLQGTVRVIREDQQFNSDRATARLSDDNDVVTFIELRGNSRVAGGAGIDTMSARDIDLDYSNDGQVLERVSLSGAAAIALTGRNGAPGRQMGGERLDLDLSTDGIVTRAVGRENVRLVLPASDDTPARTIESQSLDATGDATKGLTAAQFSGGVAYREDAPAGRPPRSVRAQELRTALAGDAVTSAVFTGSTSFEEQGLRATAGTIRYIPDTGNLHLSGSVDGRNPRVSDERVTIDAQAIEVTLDGRHMVARGSVRSTMRPAQPAGDGVGATASRLPGLFKQEEAATVTASELQYRGDSGRAVYTGGVTLAQGSSSIRAEQIELDQQTGDLFASGDARSQLSLDGGDSIGRGREIRFEEARRLITYTAASPSSSAQRGRGPAAAALAELRGPQGELRAQLIEVALAKQGNRVERLDAHHNVSMKVDAARTATATRLTYYAEDDRYELTGGGTVPVTLVDATPPECRETTGKTLTFYKSTDRILVDGQGEYRTQSQSKPCSAATRR